MFFLANLLKKEPSGAVFSKLDALGLMIIVFEVTNSLAVESTISLVSTVTLSVFMEPVRKLKLNNKKALKNKSISFRWIRGNRLHLMNSARKRISFKPFRRERPFAWTSLGRIAIAIVINRYPKTTNTKNQRLLTKNWANFNLFDAGFRNWADAKLKLRWKNDNKFLGQFNLNSSVIQLQRGAYVESSTTLVPSIWSSPDPNGRFAHIRSNRLFCSM